MTPRHCLLVLFLLLATGCGSTAAPATMPEPSAQAAPAEAPTHPRAEDVFLRWGVETNYLENGFRSALTLRNEGRVPLVGDGWTLYFNFVRTIRPESLPPGVRVERVNGDFWKLTPTDQFAPLPPGEAHRLPFEAGAWAIKESDAPAGFYFVFDDEAPAEAGSVTVEPFTEKRQTDRRRGDDLTVPTPESRYRANAHQSRLPEDQVGRITPTPAVLEAHAGTVTLDRRLSIHHGEGLEAEAAFLADALAPLLGERPRVRADTLGGAQRVVVERGAVALPAEQAARRSEAYRLAVDPERGVQITGATRKAVFYGLQSLRGLLPPTAHDSSAGAVEVGAVTIRDAPRFGYRGLHLDVARNFHTRATVKKLLDLMALYKLNTFHFHLTDDEGWRVPIEELPELTAVGGRRGHPQPSGSGRRAHLVPSYGSGPSVDTAASYGSGFYSRAGFKEILRYARERHITVVPEIDVPGHARAAIVAMEARYERLREAGRPDAARRYRLQDPDDASEYRSIQGWEDNVVNVCRPSTYRFYETVVDDLREMYAEAGVPLRAVHVGGDEVPAGVWERSPACRKLIERSDSLHGTSDLQHYFFERLYDLLAERDLMMAGWQEVALVEAHAEDGEAHVAADPFFAGRRVRPYVWTSGGADLDYAYLLANAGYEPVLSHASHLYLDMAYDAHPQESGSYWAAFTDTRKTFSYAPFALRGAGALTEEGRANILGLQGQLWSETLIGPERLEYMAVPRVLALAERAWSPRPAWASEEDDEKRRRLRDADWNAFTNRLGQRELLRLDHLFGGVAYRLPPPGAVIEAGQLRANTAYPGLRLRYTTDGTTPTTASPRYTGPVKVGPDGVVKVRSFSSTGRGSRVVTVENR
jgi:hexosaminidase